MAGKSQQPRKGNAGSKAKARSTSSSIEPSKWHAYKAGAAAEAVTRRIQPKPATERLGSGSVETVARIVTEPVASALSQTTAGQSNALEYLRALLSKESPSGPWLGVTQLLRDDDNRWRGRLELAVPLYAEDHHALEQALEATQNQVALTAVKGAKEVRIPTPREPGVVPTKSKVLPRPPSLRLVPLAVLLDEGTTAALHNYINATQGVAQAKTQPGVAEAAERVLTTIDELKSAAKTAGLTDSDVRELIADLRTPPAEGSPLRGAIDAVLRAIMPAYRKARAAEASGIETPAPKVRESGATRGIKTTIDITLSNLLAAALNSLGKLKPPQAAQPQGPQGVEFAAPQGPGRPPLAGLERALSESLQGEGGQTPIVRTTSEQSSTHSAHDWAAVAGGRALRLISDILKQQAPGGVPTAVQPQDLVAVANELNRRRQAFAEQPTQGQPGGQALSAGDTTRIADVVRSALAVHSGATTEEYMLAALPAGKERRMQVIGAGNVPAYTQMMLREALTPAGDANYREPLINGIAMHLLANALGLRLDQSNYIIRNPPVSNTGTPPALPTPKAFFGPLKRIADKVAIDLQKNKLRLPLLLSPLVAALAEPSAEARRNYMKAMHNRVFNYNGQPPGRANLASLQNVVGFSRALKDYIAAYIAKDPEVHNTLVDFLHPEFIQQKLGQLAHVTEWITRPEATNVMHLLTEIGGQKMVARALGDLNLPPEHRQALGPLVGALVAMLERPANAGKAVTPTISHITPKAWDIVASEAPEPLEELIQREEQQASPGGQ